MACKTEFPRWNINLFMHKNVVPYVLKIELRPVISERLWSFTWTSYSSRNYILYFNVLVCRKFDSKWRFHTARDAPGDARRPPVPQVWKTSHGEG